MPETTESARRWNGYVCPDCRFVFRVPRDHDGRGVVCPSCRRMLKIPAATDRPPPLVMPLRTPPREEVAMEAASLSDDGRRRKRKSRRGEDHSWDRSPGGARHSSRRERKQMILWLVGGLALFVSIIAAVLIAMQGKSSPSAPPPVVSKPKDGAPVAKPAETTLAMSDVEFLAKAEPLAKRFLEARSIQDLLPLVRNPLLAEPRMKSLYPVGRIEAVGLNQFNTLGEVNHVDNHMAVQVRTGDFEERPMNFVITPEGIRIDWESWVLWSEMPWTAFLTEKLTAGMTFRVRLEQVDYYNTAFSDDVKWQSYQLSVPGQDKSVYGYVERGSDLDQRLHLPSDVRQVDLTLRLRFPENARSGNQVLIDGLVSENWVIENETSP